jgi:hypothetical protein
VSDPATDLQRAFVAAYRPHVVRRLAEHGIDPPEALDAALEDGERWLAVKLSELLGHPYSAQRRGPLEVFQEAMRFPTDALASSGVAAQQRDPAAAAALPGDRYDLAPASSQDLGEEAWRAHLAWGAAKAGAIARPAVGVLSSDLMDSARIEEAADASGYRVVVWRSPPEIGERRPAVAFIDLSHPDADEAIGSLAAAGVRVYGFGPHVDDFAMVRARSLGAVDALARSRFFRSIPDLLPSPI